MNFHAYNFLSILAVGSCIKEIVILIQGYNILQVHNNFQ